MEVSPSWLLYQAVDEDIEKACNDSYDVINERDVRNDANVIGSHVVYKVKIEE